MEEQARIYREVIGAFPGKKVVVRTLDAGSDKPLKFANFAEEENPALGVRGLRLAIDQPSLLTNQLDAIKAASDHTELGFGLLVHPLAFVILTLSLVTSSSRAPCWPPTRWAPSWPA